MDEQRVVMSLGGSLLFDENGMRKDYIRSLLNLFKESGKSFGIVVGGGMTARIYAQAMREMGLSEFECDEVAILSTHQNARVIAYMLGGAYVKDFEEAYSMRREKYVVMGGTIPGITTDGDAALLAERLHASHLINLSTIDGIYDKDPRKHPDAKKYDKLSFEELVSLASRMDARKAGQHFVFDLFACTIVRRSRIETHFVNGNNLENVKKAINQEEHSGTVVCACDRA